MESKLLLVRSYTNPLDIIVLRYALIALGVPKDVLQGDFNTEDLLRDYNIRIMTIKEFSQTPEVREAALKHIREFHANDVFGSI